MSTSAHLLEQLFILGDLFEYWVGDDGVGSLGHDSVETAIRKTVDSGTPVFFLHGNRDFLVGEEFARRTGCTLLPDPVVISLDQQDVLLSHGDALCTDDVEHQQARKQMLSSKWKMTFLEKPLSERIQTATALRHKSKSEKQTKSMAIMDVNQQSVEALMQQYKVDIMIHGHTHLPAVHQFELNGKPVRRYVLGDWYTQRSVLYYNRGKFVLKK